MKENGRECDRHMNLKAVRVRRREGDKDKKGINERKRKSLNGYTLVMMGMMMMMIIFTADPQKIKLYVLNFTVKNRKIRSSLHWQCAYYLLTFRIVSA
jgi:hypothetical protein